MNTVHSNTQKNVNKSVLSYLFSVLDKQAHVTILDVPCGKGEFLTYLDAHLNNKELIGIDIQPSPLHEHITFKQCDVSREFPIDESKQFDVITSISGVMAIENGKYFLENCSKRLKQGGHFIITNDNVFTVRDRLSYLLVGRVRRFKLLFDSNEGNNQQIPIQELQRILSQCNIRIKEIIYTSFYFEDIFFIPFALLLFPFQYFYVVSRKSTVPKATRVMMFPWQSLLYRHYIIIGEKS